MFPPLEAYKGGKPNPAPVISAIQIILTRHFGFRFQISNMRLDGIDFVVDDLDISIEFSPERLDIMDPRWRLGSCNHNGRWRLQLECPAISPVLRRPTNEQLDTAIEGFVKSIQISLDRLSPNKPKFRVIQGGKK